MLERIALTSLTDAIGQFPVVGLLGPRWVGKTTLPLALGGGAIGE